MAICRDPALSYLNGQGYNVVRLPRAGIEPLDVLGKDGPRLERLGVLPQIWQSDKTIPNVSLPGSAAAINGQTTAALKPSIGLKLLGEIFKGFGVTGPSLNVAYSNARSLQLCFLDVDIKTIDPFVLGDYLSEGDLATTNPVVNRYFEDDDTDVFVIFEVLRSNKISVIALDSSGADASVDIAAIQDLAEGKVEITNESNQQSLITYQGEQSLTFGFKVFGLAYDAGRWQVEGIAPSPDLAFGINQGVSGFNSALLLSSGRIVLK